MDFQILFARIFSVLILIFVSGLLISKDYYSKELPKILQDRGLLMMGGAFDIVLAVLLITFHNIWTSDWTVLITIFGWLALIEGVWLIVFPKTVSFVRPLLKPKNFYTFILPAYLVLGLVFGYYGFVA